MSNVMKVTETGNSYWDGTGAYNEQYTELYNELVPGQGEADTVNGELIRSVSRLSHDYFNNGNGNARVEVYEEPDNSYWYDEDEESDDSYWYDDEEYTTEISEFFLHFTDYIVTTIGTPEIEEIITDICDIIMNDVRPEYDDKTVDKYNKMVDIVMHYVLTHENEPREINQN